MLSLCGAYLKILVGKMVYSQAVLLSRGVAQADDIVNKVTECASNNGRYLPRLISADWLV
jgi:hypothetical protein